jgi:hypothetical protein
MDSCDKQKNNSQRTDTTTNDRRATANTDNMGKLFVTLFAFAPAPKTNW